jgi:hypothetical protein
MGGMRFAVKTAPQDTTWPDMLAVWKEDGGRLGPGIGAGWNEDESGAYGIELGGPEGTPAMAAAQAVRLHHPGPG